MANRLVVKVCVGSSCHIRGGTKTLRALETLIDNAELNKRIDLKADLCLENCLQAPNVVVGDELYGGVTPDKVEAFFKEHILPRVEQ